MTPAQIVAELYQDVLGRRPDAAGLQFWASLLEKGTSSDQIRAEMMKSPEGRARVTEEVRGLYRNLLGREADAGGLAYWVNEIVTNGKSITQVRGEFQASTEYLTRPPGTGPTGLPGSAPGDGSEDKPTTTPGQGPDDRTGEGQTAVEYLRSAYGWIDQLGIADQLLAWVRENPDLARQPDVLVGKIRQTEQYKSMFANIRRPDGTLRMTEGQYLSTLDAYGKVLTAYGMSEYTRDQLAGFIGSEVDAKELEERLGIWQQVQRADDVKAAFYVYAGMRVGDEDLYQAIVDPSYQRALADEYNQRATMTTLDYDTWITRATEVGLSQLAQRLTQLEESGADSSEALAQLRSMDPEVAKQFMTVLHLGTQPDGKPLALSELQYAFENALLGSAAAAQGLGLPSTDRIEAIRSAGVTRAAALQQYGTYAKDRNLLQGMAARAGQEAFGQSDFEAAVFLRQGDAVRRLEQMTGQEEALGKATQGASFTTRNGRIGQAGLRV